MSEKETNKVFSYFYKLELEGINCFKDKQVLDLSNGKNYAAWTIILGDNGTGKTTLLKILDRIKPFDLPLVDNGKELIAPVFTYDVYRKEYLINLKKDVSIYLKNANNIIKIPIYNREDDTYGVYNPQVGNFKLLSYGASRRMSRNQDISFKSNDRLQLTSLFDESIELINAEEWFLQKEMIALKAEKSSKAKFENQFNLVKLILIDILPDVEDIRVKPINENNSKLLLEVQTPYGWVNLRDLSFGYQTVTALIVDIAAKMMEQYPNSENPLTEPVIILIDEIDLHLHPKWQRTVLDKLSEHFPAAQFIATSHSPLIVQAAQDRGANIVVCRKEGDRVIIDNDPEEVKGWRVDQILVSDLFNVQGSHSIEIQPLIVEKNKILSKRQLDDNDRNRLESINFELENLPSAHGKKDMEAEDIIKKAAELLKK